MKVGDLVKIHKSGKIVIYLGTVDGCYEFWCPQWNVVHLSVDTFPPDKWEVIE
jgi:hypothetical protein